MSPTPVSPIKVGVLGALGKMGATVCSAVNQDSDLELSAMVDSAASGGDVYSSLSQALKAPGPGIDVAVDFTNSKAAENHLEILAKNGVHAVIGTSGLSPKKVNALKGLFKESNCIIASNFSISAVIMMKLAEIAAPFFDSAEIIETHHAEKIDAPSATALETLSRMEKASNTWMPDPTQKQNLPNARGAVGKSGIHIHSLRVKGTVAHQEILLGAEGQSLSIRQDTYERSAFMPGVLLAVKQVFNYPGITVGLEKILGI